MNRFIWKLVLNGIVIIPFLYWFTNASILGIVITAIILAAISYLIGDQFILRRTNNAIATIADAVLAYIFLWVVASTFDWTLTTNELLITVISIAIVEAIYHYLLVHFWGEARDEKEIHHTKAIDRNMATQEFSEELGNGKRVRTEMKEEEDPNIYRWDD